MRYRMTKRVTSTVVAVMIALSSAQRSSLAQGDELSSTASAATREAIRSEVGAFYHDLEAKDWVALLTHFWPAKITARWEPPEGSAGWRTPAANTIRATNGSGGASWHSGDDCAPARPLVMRSDVRVEGRWARVLVARCAEKDAELWLLDVNGRWKIVRLVL
jgi:hypothetical protein